MKLVNLFCRTEYSFKTAFGQSDKVMEAGGLGVCDRGGTWGHISFYHEAKKRGLNVALGVELPVTDKSDEKRASIFYYRFLAKTPAGLKRIYEITTEATKDDQGRLSRVIFSDINQRDVAIVAPSEDARKAPRNCYVAVTQSSIESNVRVARERGLIPLAGSDNFYPRPEHYECYEIIAGRNTQSQNKSYHILSLAEYMAEVPWAPIEGIKNAEKLYKEISGIPIPTAEMIKFDSKKTLRQLCIEGAKFRGIDLKNKVYLARMDRELSMIADKKFEDYFFVLIDMIIWAKKRMMVGPARGSSCGSLVCYLTQITDIDPIKYDLLFERFIDITRADLPDIDVDFQDNRRELVFNYVREKYGSERVSRIGTISRYKSDSAIRDVANALRIPLKETAALKTATLKRSSGDARAMLCIADTFTENAVGREFIAKYPEMMVAAEIEEHASHTGQHAAGIAITQHPITNYCSIDLRTGTAMVDKADAEKLGLLKIDALGLRTLSVIQDCLDQIKKNTEWLLEYPRDDKKAFDILNKGRFTGVFQYEGQAVQGLCRQMKIENIEDVIVLTALARPGPLVSGSATDFIQVRTGKKPVKYLHELAKPATEISLGAIIYQEQVMRLGREVGGLDWEDVSTLRKAMSKSLGKEYFDKFFDKFWGGAKKRNISLEEAHHIWDHMNTMGSWAFNRCISGDTKIRMAIPGSNLKKEMTIEALYDMYVANPTAWVKQNKRTPLVISLFPDGRAWPQNAVAIHKNGIKKVIEIECEDGFRFKCTEDHKFMVNGEWGTISLAAVGDYLTIVKTERLKFEYTGKGKGHNKGKKYKKPNKGFSKGKNNPSWDNGRSPEEKKFKADREGTHCDNCNKKKPSMEVHHKDFCSGRNRPKDLAWLCNSCHKKEHYKNGRRKIWEKGYIQDKIKITCIKNAGSEMTYDLEMPEHHNFALANGVITHNSHSVAYGLISYWCLVLKSKYPLEYAAAQLRNAKDDDQTTLILRDLVKEGFKYVPVDIKKSDISWTSVGNVLYGGLQNIKGVGIVAAQKIIEWREKGTKLPPALLEKTKSPVTPFDNIFEAETKFLHYYEEPEENGITGHVWRMDEVINEMPRRDVVMLGKLKTKNVRDANETISVQKRGGRLIEGQSLALNFRLADDTGIIQCRIKQTDYLEMALPIVDGGIVDSDWYMVRGRYAPDFGMFFVEKIKNITKEAKDDSNN